MINFKLSNEGLQIALMALAFNVGRSCAAKGLGELNAERKAAQDTDHTDAPSIDRFSDFANSVREQDIEDGARTGTDTTDEALAASSPTNEDYRDSGSDRKVTFVEYCVLYAALNDALVAEANGGTWPRPQSTASLLDYLCRPRPRTSSDDAVAGAKAMIEAYTGKPCTLSDDELKGMAEGDAQAQAELYAQMYETNRQDIIDRIEAGCTNYNRFSETSWQTLFNNLPENIKFSLLGAITFKLDDKCKELLTGRLGSGAVSKGANRPLLVRAAEISVLRGDMLIVATERGKLQRSGPEEQAGRQLPAGTTVTRKSDGPAADKALAKAA